MKNSNLLKTGISRSYVSAVCCFTPTLVPFTKSKN